MCGNTSPHLSTLMQAVHLARLQGQSPLMKKVEMQRIRHKTFAHNRGSSMFNGLTPSWNHTKQSLWKDWFKHRGSGFGHQVAWICGFQTGGKVGVGPYTSTCHMELSRVKLCFPLSSHAFGLQAPQSIIFESCWYQWWSHSLLFTELSIARGIDCPRDK